MALSNIVIADGATTPVNHTYVPQNGQIGNTPATWFEKIVSFSSLAWRRVTSLVQLSAKPTGDHKCSMQIHVPFVRTVDGSEVLDGTISSYVTMVIPANLATDVNLKDIKALTANLMDQTVAAEVFSQLKPST
jgi:hypothetical protein